jgi:hypothetical protein
MYYPQKVYSIESVKRFLYLNIYAFTLLGIAIVIALLPLYEFSWLYMLIQYPLAIGLAYWGFDIISRWDRKVKDYNLLIERNKQVFRSDTFTGHMMVPCGRLLTKLVLKDLGHEDKYKELKEIAWSKIKEDLREEILYYCKC